MSMRLDQGTMPRDTEVKASYLGDVIFTTVNPTRQISMSMADFAETVIYVLTNTDLVADDLRLSLMERLRRVRVVDGYNGSSTHRLSVEGLPGSKPRGVVPDRRSLV